MALSPLKIENTQEEEASHLRAELHDPATTVRFMLAGDAYVTFQSRRTGVRYTYRVEAAKGAWRGERQGIGKTEVYTGPSHFVSVLTGPDNGRSYEYLGCIYSRRAYAHGRNSRVGREATSAIAFAWVWRTLTGGKMHPELAVYHEGRCGKCGRRLTTPRSIETGLGPVCEGKTS